MRKSHAILGTSLFFALAPGVVAGLIPYLLTGWQFQPGPLLLRLVGAVLCLTGAVFLIHAFWRFASEGLGTPAPIAPTERLVTGGPYRYVRNPMYLAVLVTIAGQALLFAQPVLWLYDAAAALAVVLFVHFYEQPTLARRYGAEYEAYRRAVPGWYPRLTPWKG